MAHMRGRILMEWPVDGVLWAYRSRAVSNLNE